MAARFCDAIFFMQKKSKKIWQVKKNVYLCIPFGNEGV